jgi:valyl-tRNA synthetase
LVGTTIGSDISFDENKVKGYKHFANKLWNIARFIFDATKDTSPSPAELSKADAALLESMQTLVKETTEDIEAYRVYLAAEKIYHYVWHELADKIIEESKPTLAGTDETAKRSRQSLLLMLLDSSLKLLHPFMPFITEEIYQQSPTKDAEFLMIAHWPVVE